MNERVLIYKTNKRIRARELWHDAIFYVHHFGLLKREPKTFIENSSGPTGTRQNMFRKAREDTIWNVVVAKAIKEFYLREGRVSGEQVTRVLGEIPEQWLRTLITTDKGVYGEF